MIIFTSSLFLGDFLQTGEDGRVVPLRHRTGLGEDDEVGLGAQDLAADVLAETRHDGQRGDQGRHADGDAGHGDDAGQRTAQGVAVAAKIPKGEEEFEFQRTNSKTDSMISPDEAVTARRFMLARDRSWAFLSPDDTQSTAMTG